MPRMLIEIFGWTGSLMVVMSLVLASQLRFRWYNLIGSLIATIYNLIFCIWPFVLMNGAIVLIDAYWIARLKREQKAREQFKTPVPLQP